VRLGGRTLALDRHSPSRAIRAGLALVPGDRARRAAVLDASAADNLTLGNLTRHSRHGRLRPDLIASYAAGLMRDGGVRPVEPGRELRTFSGGNQQKAVLAKWLDRDPAVLLLDEPVHGVDVASRAQILARLTALAATGTSILLATADHDDLVAVCDLVLVFAAGRVTARLRGDALTTRGLLGACHSPAPVRNTAAPADRR
jgi:ribose transport system ATP-binding protein